MKISIVKKFTLESDNLEYVSKLIEILDHAVSTIAKRFGAKVEILHRYDHWCVDEQPHIKNPDYFWVEDSKMPVEEYYE